MIAVVSLLNWKAYSETCQTSKTERFPKTVNDFQQLTSKIKMTHLRCLKRVLNTLLIVVHLRANSGQDNPWILRADVYNEWNNHFEKALVNLLILFILLLTSAARFNTFYILCGRPFSVATTASQQHKISCRDF